TCGYAFTSTRTGVQATASPAAMRPSWRRAWRRGMVCMRVSVRDAHTMDRTPQGPAKWSAAIVKRWVKGSLLGPNRLGASGQRERHDVVAERRSQSPVAPGGDDDVLLATGRQLIGHRGRLAAGRQRGAPRLLP